MTAPASLTYRTSRAKGLPLVIAAFLLVFVLGLMLLALVVTAVEGGIPPGAWLLVLFIGAGFCTMAWAEAKLTKQLIQPDTLTLTAQGFRITRFGKPSAFEWADLREPYVKWVSNGKTSSRVIALPYPRSADGEVVIRAEKYVVPLEVVFSAIEQARLGRVPAPVRGSVPALYAYFVLPVAIGTALFFFGTLGLVTLGMAYGRG